MLHEHVSHINSKERMLAYQQHCKRFGHIADDYLPILINKQLFALDKDSTVFDKGILNAVTKGVCIQTPLSMSSSYNDEFYVDITNIQTA